MASATAQPPAEAQRAIAVKAKADLAAELQALREKLAATEAALTAAKAEQHVLVGNLASTVPVEEVFEAVSLTTVTLAEQPSVRTAKFEYLFVRVNGANQDKFGEILKEHEGRGWEYAGTTPLAEPQRDVWVFRRPVVTGTVTLSADAIYTAPTLTLSSVQPAPASAKPAVPSKPAKPVAKATAEPAPAAVVEGRLIEAVRPTQVRPSVLVEGKPVEILRATQVKPPVTVEGRLVESASPRAVTGGRLALTTAAGEAAEAEKLQAEIDALQTKLSRLKPVVDAKPVTITFGKEDTVLEPVTLGHLLLDLGQKKFGTGGRITVQVKNGAVSVTGDKRVVDWAAAAVKSIKVN